MIGTWVLSDIAAALPEAEHPIGTAWQHVQVASVTTDSRNVPEGSVFVALVGERFDGHDFIAEVERQGAAAVVASRQVSTSLPVFIVDNTLTALGKLGYANRQRFSGKVAAVTGSSGKTTVKEMLAAIMATQGSVLATKGNLNNEIGAPQTLLQLSDQHQYGVIELGASAIGEIARTVAMTCPHVSILNNAAGAHLEGFGSLAGVVQAKGEIIDGLLPGGTAVINGDDPHFSIWQQRAAEQSLDVLVFGFDAEWADVRAYKTQISPVGTWGFELHLPDGTFSPVQLALPGQHNIRNALAAAAAAFVQGVTVEDIATGLEQVRATPGRCFPIITADGMRLLDDTYNANPASMKAAIDMLMSLPGPQVLTLGSMAELGDSAVDAHFSVGRYAAECGVPVMFCCGPFAAALKEGFDSCEGKGQAFSFTDKQTLIDQLRNKVDASMVVLCKGSRSAQMEVVIQALRGETN